MVLVSSTLLGDTASYHSDHGGEYSRAPDGAMADMGM